VRVSKLFLTVLGLSVAQVAAAQCPAPYSSDNVLADLAGVEDALRTGNSMGASQGAERIQAGIGCLNEVLPPMIIGRVYRAIGAGLVAGGDEFGGFDWFLTAIEVDPTFDYGLEDFPPDHPARFTYEDAKKEIQSPAVPAGDQAFGDGTHYLDGRKITTAEAKLGRPHLYQIEIEGSGVRSWVIKNNDFPDEAFSAAVAAVDEGDKKKKDKKKKKKDKDGEVATTGGGSGSSVQVITRERPWEKTPLMIGGALVIGGAGALYALSASKERQFQDAGTEEDVEQYRQATNQFFIASGVVLGLGVGTLTYGIILDGGTPVPTVNFRF